MKESRQAGLRWAISIAAIGSLGVVIAWILTFHGHTWSADSARWSDFGGYIGGTLAPILAFASFIGLLVSLQEQRLKVQLHEEREDSKIYLENAVVSLERAYAEIMKGSEGSVPRSDRLTWLTTARLLLSASEISSKITVGSIRKMYEAHEEHWRKQFYNVFDPHNFKSPMNNSDYFRQGERETPGYVIDERSMKVIFEFCEWPKARQDPLSAVDKFSDAELDEMKFGRKGAADFIRSRKRTNV